MAEKLRNEPFPPTAITPKMVLEQTRPNEPISVAAAEVRIAELHAHISAIGRQIDDKSKSRRRAWASDPHGDWKKSAMAAREELRKEQRALQAWLDHQDEGRRRGERVRRNVDELRRQEVDKSTRDARRMAKKSGEQVLWDLYLKVEVSLLEIIHAHGVGIVGPLGESLLYTAGKAVPEWYREHWLRTVYGTTWGRQAEALAVTKK